MIINIFEVKGDLNGKIVMVRFFFCRVYITEENIKIEINILFLIKTSLRSHIVCLYLHIEQGLLYKEIQLNSIIQKVFQRKLLIKF